MALLIASVILDHHLFFVPYYFLAASLLSYLWSWRPYGLLSKGRLVLYFDTFLRKQIVLNLNEIESVDLETEMFEGFLSRQRHTYAIESLVFKLRKPLNEDHTKKIIGKKPYRMIPHRADIIENGTKLILYHRPKGGFESLKNVLTGSVDAPQHNAIPGDKFFAGLVLYFPWGFILATLMVVMWVIQCSVQG